ncbi:MAG TPA: hypothetical protein VFX73_13400, partial [Chitinophagaceae bacterium]|nr:hypothetical protein [Chitinophagaceae bacterium]
MRIIGKTNSNLLFTVRLAMVLLFSTAAKSQTWNGRTVAVNGNTGGFYEYLPTGYNDAGNSTKNYPLIVFLHGLGELGNGSTDLPKILNTGLPQYINQGKFPSSFTVGGTNFSFIVICPQFIGWPGAPDVEAVINYASQKYRVDASRIYVTGLSMGGGATWDYAGSSATAASRIAAIVPICGATWPDINKAKIMATANLPVWATHNDGDGTVAVSNTNGFVDGINSFNPAVKAQKTIWQSWGHDAWTKTYDPAYKLDGVRNTYEWMLLYTRNGATPPPPPPPSITAWISKTTDVTCNGSGNGSATVSLSGGAAPYTYSWNSNPVQTGSTATNLAPGSYVVTIKDANNTTATATATINEPAKLQLNVAAGTISTTGGTTNVTVSAAGGVAPYSFTGPTSNVAAGTYTYKVTDSKGCTDSKTITITEPATLLPPPPPPPGGALAISIVGTTNVSCNGGNNGTASVTVTGGVAPYTYSWNSNPAQTGLNAANLSAGSYIVTVKDAANTTVSATVTITQPDALVLTANAGTITGFGGTTSVNLSAQGGVAPYSFEGNTSGLSAGNYSFGVTDAVGCKAKTTVTISQPGQIVLKGSHEPIKCKGGKTNVTLTAEGGKAPYVFQGQTTD